MCTTNSDACFASTYLEVRLRSATPLRISSSKAQIYPSGRQAFARSFDVPRQSWSTCSLLFLGLAESRKYPRPSTYSCTVGAPVLMMIFRCTAS